MARAKSVQIYLKRGIEQDDLLLALWDVCRIKSRPQEIFRGMMLRGYESMRASGELPDSIVAAVDEALAEGLPEVPVKKSPPRKTAPSRPDAPVVSGAPSSSSPKPEPETEDMGDEAGGKPQDDTEEDETGSEAPKRPASKAPFHIGDIM